MITLYIEITIVLVLYEEEFKLIINARNYKEFNILIIDNAGKQIKKQIK